MGRRAAYAPLRVFLNNRPVGKLSRAYCGAPSRPFSKGFPAGVVDAINSAAMERLRCLR